MNITQRETLEIILKDHAGDQLISYYPIANRSWNKVYRVCGRRASYIVKKYNPMIGDNTELRNLINNAKSVNYDNNDKYSLAIPLENKNNLSYAILEGIYYTVMMDCGSIRKVTNGSDAIKLLNWFRRSTTTNGLAERKNVFSLSAFQFVTREQKKIQYFKKSLSYAKQFQMIIDRIIELGDLNVTLTHGDFKINNICVCNGKYVVLDLDNLRLSLPEDDASMLLLSLSCDTNIKGSIYWNKWERWEKEFVENGFEKELLYINAIIHVLRLSSFGSIELSKARHKMTVDILKRYLNLCNERALW